MPDNFHGLRFPESSSGLVAATAPSTAIIGLVATATAAAGAPSAALDAAFPVNRPVLVTDVRTAIAAAGSGGTLAAALTAIAAQGSPIVVVVRVTAGADQATTDAAVIGGSAAGHYTGIQALLSAQGQLGVRPRILGAPGLDSQAVTQALVAAAKTLRGFVYARAIGATVAEALTYADDFGDRELMLIWPDATGWAGKAVATAMGLRAAIDEATGWHKSLSNVAISGVTGLTADVHFDLVDQSTDAGLLNAGNVTTLVNMNGYRFWGNRTTSTDPAFAFEVATRTAQALQDELAVIEAPYIDRPMTQGLVRDLIEDGQAMIRDLVRQGRLISGRVYFDGSVNPAQNLAAGQLRIEAEYTAVAPLEGLTTALVITSAGYAGFGDELTTNLADDAQPA